MDLSVADKAVNEPAAVLVESMSLTELVADPQARETIVRRIVSDEASDGVLKVAAFQSFI